MSTCGRTRHAERSRPPVLLELAGAGNGFNCVAWASLALLALPVFLIVFSVVSGVFRCVLRTFYRIRVCYGH